MNSFFLFQIQQFWGAKVKIAQNYIQGNKKGKYYRQLKKNGDYNELLDINVFLRSSFKPNFATIGLSQNNMGF